MSDDRPTDADLDALHGLLDRAAESEEYDDAETMLTALLQRTVREASGDDAADPPADEERYVLGRDDGPDGRFLDRAADLTVAAVERSPRHAAVVAFDGLDPSPDADAGAVAALADHDGVTRTEDRFAGEVPATPDTVAAVTALYGDRLFEARILDADRRPIVSLWDGHTLVVHLPSERFPAVTDAPDGAAVASTDVDADGRNRRT